MAYYDYKCCKCGKVQKNVKHGMSESPLVACGCGYTCRKVITSDFGISGSNKEVWDYDEVHKVKPRYVKSRDGKVREKYDPLKHGNAKGAQSHMRKFTPKKKAPKK